MRITGASIVLSPLSALLLATFRMALVLAARNDARGFRLDALVLHGAPRMGTFISAFIDCCEIPSHVVPLWFGFRQRPI